MCGRAILVTPVDVLRELFGLFEVPELLPRYNIAPTQPIALIRSPHRLELVRWGLLLPGAAAPKINLRVESVRSNPSTRELARARRCLVMVDGFYEWKREGKARLPFLFTQQGGKPFALGGVWTTSTMAGGAAVDTCAILTRAAEEPVRALHDRMPLVIPADGYARWLEAGEPVGDLFAGGEREEGKATLVARPVSTVVNSAANDDVRCLEER